MLLPKLQTSLVRAARSAIRIQACYPRLIRRGLSLAQFPSHVLSPAPPPELLDASPVENQRRLAGLRVLESAFGQNFERP